MGGAVMKYAYIRVSTIEQNEARQLEAMRKYEIPEENYYIEKISGKDTNRPKLKELLSIVQEGDVIHIHDFSRLSRSVADLLKIVEELQKKSVYLVSNKENLDTSTPTGKLMLTVIGAINEFERASMLERQKEGVAIARKNGVYDKNDIDMGRVAEMKKEINAGRLTITAAAQELGISRLSMRRRLDRVDL
jgi:DNA invertase Pin-like site-specific DNA recombinase